MKILHTIFSMDPAQGGPPAVVARLAAGQALLGHEVHVASYPMSGGREAASSYARIPGFDRVHSVALAPEPSTLERLIGSGVRRFIGRALEQLGIEVIHLHGVWETLLRVTAAEARRQGIPYFVMPHGMLDPWSMAQSRRKKQLAMLLGHRRMLDAAAALHLVNADERDLIAPLRLRSSQVIIPNGIFFEEIEPLPQRGGFYAAHPELKGRPYILFLSRLHFKKGLDYLADAFGLVAARLPEVQLVVAGPADGGEDDFRQRIERAALADRVHRVGPLYGPDKLAAYVDAACFCLPSRQEGFSMAITEAMGCGLAVVISRACHFPEVATVGAGEVVDLDPRLIADALVRILSDPASRQRMGQAGRNLIAQRFTWQRIAESSIHAYQEERRRCPSGR